MSGKYSDDMDKLFFSSAPPDVRKKNSVSLPDKKANSSLASYVELHKNLEKVIESDTLKITIQPKVEVRSEKEVTKTTDSLILRTINPDGSVREIERRHTESHERTEKILAVSLVLCFSVLLILVLFGYEGILTKRNKRKYDAERQTVHETSDQSGIAIQAQKNDLDQIASEKENSANDKSFFEKVRGAGNKILQGLLYISPFARKRPGDSNSPDGRHFKFLLILDTICMVLCLIFFLVYIGLEGSRYIAGAVIFSIAAGFAIWYIGYASAWLIVKIPVWFYFLGTAALILVNVIIGLIFGVIIAEMVDA